MKVLHVVPSIGPLTGGPGAMVRTMARGLARIGIDVDVATTDGNGAGRLQVPLGVPVSSDGATYWYFRRQTKFYTVSCSLAAWLARHGADYDLFHIHGLFTWASVVSARWARLRGIPYIVGPLGTLNQWGMTQRHPWLKRVALRLLDEKILTRATHIHYTSEQERTQAESSCVLDHATVVSLGIDFAEFEDLPPPGRLRQQWPTLAGRRIVLFLSRLDRVKGLDLLLKAVACLREQGQKLAVVVAGSGPPDFEAALRREAARLGLEGDVLWVGFLEGPDKLTAFADADVFVLPSYSENFGIAVVEAMGCGVPVVISDRVGINREVGAAKAGLVVPCRVDELTDAIRRLVVDPELRRHAGENGRRLAQQRFSMEAMTAGLVEMYQESLLQKKKEAVPPFRPSVVLANLTRTPTASISMPMGGDDADKSAGR